MKTLNLAGHWRLHSTRRKLEVPALLPGDIHSALLKTGEIPDPFWADNELKVQWVGRENWIYEREINVPVSFLKEKSVFLSVENIDTVAVVKINGRKAGRSHNAFVRHRFEVKKLLQPGANRITIEFASPEMTAIAEAAKLPYPVPSPSAPIQSPHRNVLRKPQCHGGWDWGLCLTVSGIKGPFYLGATSLARIEYVTTDQKHSRAGVEVTVRCEVESPEGGPAPFEVELDGQKLASTVQLHPGLNQLRQVVRIPKPKLWWPHDLGAQPLYDLTVCVGDDLVRKRIGLRTVKVVNRADKEGLSMGFVVNGAPIFCKGANWIPADAMPQRVNRAVLDDLLTSATAAHMNMIRIWGGGQYETDDFYDLCDEKGLLVWQDFMFAVSLYPAHPEFLDNVRAEARHQVKRLRDRACLAIWCGNNENIGVADWTVDDKSMLERYQIDYDRLNEGVLGNTVRELDPNTLFWPSSPCAGPGDYTYRKRKDTGGDMHYWGVWHEGKPLEEFLKLRARFCSEFGFQSFPSVEGIRTYAAEDQLNVTSPILEHHQRHGAGNARIVENMTRYFRFPEGFENFVYVSQVLQALAIKMAVEHFRGMRPYCEGALYWQLNDLWPVCSWSSLEYGGKWKLLHYAAKRFFAPLLISAEQLNDVVEIRAMNDQLKPVAARVRLRVIDFSGKVLRTIRLVKQLPAGSSVLLKKSAVKNLVADPSQAFLSLELKVGARVVRNEHFFCAYKKCTLAEPRIRVKTAAAKGGFAVTLTSEAPAFWVRLNAEKIRGEFDDNGFALLPGESKTVLFTPKAKVTLAQFREKLVLQHLRGTYA